MSFLSGNNRGTLHQVDFEEADDYLTYSELESAAASSTVDDCESITLIPLTPIDDQPPPPPPRCGSPLSAVDSRDWCSQRGTWSRSTAVRSGRSTTAAHAPCHTTSGVGSLNVVNNMAYRHRSPDVIPSLGKKPR